MKKFLHTFLLLCCGLYLHNLAQAVTNSHPFVSDQILVKYKPHVSVAMQTQTARGYGAKSIEEIANAPNISITHLPVGQTVERALSVYANDPNIESVQPNYIYYKLAQPTPMLDPDYNKMWAAKNTGQSITGTYPSGVPAPVTGTAGDDMNLEGAWNVQTDCSSIAVAVVDTGINYNASDLANSMWNGGASYPHHGWNFVDNNNDPMDYEGHGTHVAGTIGATGGNGIGITGVCWKANLMAVRVLGLNGGTTATVIAGVNFAVANGAKIINMSLGGNIFDQAFSDAITNAQNNGVLVVVAAGNETSNNDITPSYPCDFTQPNILCVAALDQNYALANFSNWGASSVDVGAPGTNILSTWAGTEQSIDLLNPASGSLILSSTTLSGGWNVYAHQNQLILTDPKSLWSTVFYQAGTDDRAYKTLNLSNMVGANVVTLTAAAAVNVRSGDFFNVNYKPSGGDPFAGGTTLYSTTNTADGTVGNYFDFDIKNCVSTACSIGVQLVSTANSARDIGVYIPSMVVHSLTLTNNGYYTASGTSMATPQTTGVAALVWAHNSSFSFTDVANAIKQGGRSIPSLAGKSTTGKAVDALGALTYIAPPAGITVNVQ